MIKKIILGLVLVIVILSGVVLANSSMQEDLRRNNINCNTNYDKIALNKYFLCPK